MPNASSEKKVKKRVKLIFGITLLIFIWYILADRYTPATDQARVKGLNLALAPLVSGYVTEVNTSLHEHVKAGDTLFRLDTKPYEIAVNLAETKLDLALQNVNSGSATLKATTAQLSQARVMLERASRNWERTQKVIQQNEGALSQSDRDASESAYYNAIESVNTAEANLERQKEQLGPLNQNNPNIQAALSALEKAQWDLENTVIIAPVDGLVESFNIRPGHFAATGQALANIVANDIIWIQANYKENNLTHITIGDEVDLIFDIAPGKVFKGKVKSVANGINSGRTNANALPNVNSTTGWLRQPQRFPVIIQVNESDASILETLKQGSQAETVVYAKDTIILRFLAKCRIKIVSILSYVR